MQCVISVNGNNIQDIVLLDVMIIIIIIITTMTTIIIIKILRWSIQVTERAFNYKGIIFKGMVLQVVII